MEFSVPFVGRVSYRVVCISEFCDAIRLEYVLSFVTVREKAFDSRGNLSSLTIIYFHVFFEVLKNSDKL